MKNQARAGRPLQGSSSASQIRSSDNHRRAISDLPGLFDCWEFFLLNPDGLAVTPNLDHNLKLAKLWGFQICSKLNPPLYIGETVFFFFFSLSYPNTNCVYLWQQSWFPFSSWCWRGRLRAAPGKKVQIPAVCTRISRNFSRINASQSVVLP